MPDAVVASDSRWEALACAAVDARRSDDGATVQAIVCPSARGASPLPRHVACCALLRTRRGSLWMLRTVGHPWTDALLAAAEVFLAAEEEHGTSMARARTLERRLARTLELPQVQVVAPALDRPDPSQWQTRALAVALRMRQLAASDAPPPAELAAQVDAIEAALARRLRAALEDLLAALDGEQTAAMAASRGDGRLYAFLSEPGRRRNRLQLAQTFPLLLRAAATGEPGSAGALIRAAVDAGAPLVDTLARHWAVSRSVLRGLRQCPVEVVGARWETSLEALVAALDALPPEFRPGAEAAKWRAFNEHLDFAGTMLGRPPWASPLALAWLRHAARQGWTRASLERAGAALTDEAVAAVELLRQALIETLRADSGASAASPDVAAARTARVWLATDRFLAGMAPRRLVEQAQRYRRELAAATTELAGEIAFASGASFWPLLPGDYVSGDRSRIVVPLTTPKELQRHGEALRICLGDSHLAGYASACLRGNTFIAAVLDAGTRLPLSTAAFHVSRPPTSGSAAVRLLEHTARHNELPSPRCALAVREVLALARTSAYQQHLRDGFRAIAERSRDPIDGGRQATRLPMRLAVKRIVGEERYAELLRLAVESRAGEIR
jgi:TPR repeat protein